MLAITFDKDWSKRQSLWSVIWVVAFSWSEYMLTASFDLDWSK